MSESLLQNLSVLFNEGLDPSLSAKNVADRKNAFHQFMELGIPNKKWEDWKYLNLKSLDKDSFTLPSDNTAFTKDNIQKLLPNIRQCGSLVFVDGILNPKLSNYEHLSSILSVNHAQSVSEPLVLQDAGVQKVQENPFIYLNKSLQNQQINIEVSKNEKIKDPLVLLHLHSNQESSKVVSPQISLVLSDNSQLHLLEYFTASPKGHDWTNALTHVTLKQDAQLTHYYLQNENLNTIHFNQVRAQVDRNATYKTHFISLGGHVSRVDFQARLNQSHSDCNFNGLFLTHHTQQMDYHTRIDHLKPHQTSSTYIKSIVDDQSKGVFNGKIVVHQDAQKIDSQMTNKNLLLSNEAEINPKPELEIYADDVKCAHGATVGQLDEDALFYFQSRGIHQELARKILTRGFAEDCLLLIEHDEIRSWIEHLVFEKMDKGVVS